MRQSTNAGWWVLLVTALFIIGAWPPASDRSLLVKAVNYLADPTDTLPVLPRQLGFGMSDDPIAVEERDALVRRYDQLFAEGGLTRLRLGWKVARDPFRPSTERQLLLAFGVIVAFAVWRVRERG